MPSYLWRPQADTDTAYSQENGGTFSTASNDLRIRSDSNPDITFRYHAGVRFIGTIPAGTIELNSAVLKGNFTNDTFDDPNCNIYLHGIAQPPAFANSFGADIMSRTYNASSYFSWVGSAVASPFEIDLTSIFRKYLEDVGGADFSDPENITPTQVDIINPTILLKANTNAPLEMRLFSYHGTAIDTRYKMPALDIHFTLNQPVLQQSDRRIHIATVTDSYGWSLQPGVSRAPGLRYSFAITLNGVVLGINTTGLLKFTDETPGGYYTLSENGTDYSITAPEVGYYPEGRQGYTEDGLLKEELVDKLNVNPTDIIIHPFGLGGTTISTNPLTNGSWTSQKDKSQPYVSLIGNSNPALDLDPADPNIEDSLTNPLWNYVDPTGATLIQLLRDTSIERLMIVQTGSGNDALQHGIENALLPMNKTPDNLASWQAERVKVKVAYKIFINFCRAVRAAAGGSEIEWIIMGYPNMPVEEPRLPTPITVNDSAPVAGTWHRGTYSGLLSNPDVEYGGAGANSKMAPYASAPAKGIWQVPHLLTYSLWPSSVNTTNVPGVAITGLPRAFEKTDLGYHWQLKAFLYFNKTFKYHWELGGAYRDWYVHWAADTYGYVATSFRPGGYDIFSPNWAEKNQWDNMWDAFRVTDPIPGGAYWTFPYPPSSERQQIIGLGNAADSVMNLKIAVPYCIRHVTQDNVNEVLQYVTLGTQDAVDELYDEAADAGDTNLQVQYVNLFDSLGSELGAGQYASAGDWAFLEGVHLTKLGSIAWIDAMIERAKPNSPMLQQMADWSYDATARFMTFFEE